jgi:lysophospholipase L1-like esterase
MKHRVRWGAALTATTLVPLTGCGVFGGGSSVTLFGDSITVLVADEVTKDAPDFDIAVDGTWGLRIDEELDPAADIALDRPDQVVINLGTNNVLQHHDTTASSEDLSTMIDLLAGARCIHIVTINEHINRMGEDFGPAAAALNAQIRTLAGRHLNVDVIDWNKIVEEHLDEGIVDDDSVHPNAAGIELLAAAYVDAIEGC